MLFERLRGHSLPRALIAGAGAATLAVVGVYLSIWLDEAIMGLRGGQILQGGAAWRALTVSFHDAGHPGRRVEVGDVRFRNVDRFLPIAVSAHAAGRDSLWASGTQAEWVALRGLRTDSLTIRTQNAGHSAEIDDLSFFLGGKAYTLTFDHWPGGQPIAPNTQLVAYPVGDLLVRFGADGAVPTVVRGNDLAGLLGRAISRVSGPLSTALILVLIALPCWMVLRFSLALGRDLSPGRFFTPQEAEAVRRHGMDLFRGGRFAPRGPGYTFRAGEVFYGILASAEPGVASDRKRLAAYCEERFHALFDDVEDRLWEAFATAGALALSLGLLGTVIGMIDAFRMLEDTVKIGEGAVRTQLRMAGHINFALVTTAAGFLGRILSIVLLRHLRVRARRQRDRAIDVVGYFTVAEPVAGSGPAAQDGQRRVQEAVG